MVELDIRKNRAFQRVNALLSVLVVIMVVRAWTLDALMGVEFGLFHRIAVSLLAVPWLVWMVWPDVFLRHWTDSVFHVGEWLAVVYGFAAFFLMQGVFSALLAGWVAVEGYRMIVDLFLLLIVPLAAAVAAAELVEREAASA